MNQKTLNKLEARLIKMRDQIDEIIDLIESFDETEDDQEDGWLNDIED